MRGFGKQLRIGDEVEEKYGIVYCTECVKTVPSLPLAIWTVGTLAIPTQCGQSAEEAIEIAKQ